MKNPTIAKNDPSNLDQIDTDLMEAFKSTATANISDNLSRLPGAVGLRPFHRYNGVMVGTALTVRPCAGDNLAIHQALEMVQPGNVIVVDGGGDISRALVGEIMITIAQTRGAAGYVIDGAVRDVGMIAGSEFPCYAKAVIHRGPYKNGPGEINVAVNVGGLIVQPGDIVIGDEDGVVAFSPRIARDLLLAVRTQEAREAEILKTIRDGRYTGAYATPSSP